ncbi:MAG: hypothetical protein P8Y52_01745 [Xanthomonadales bacterium]
MATGLALILVNRHIDHPFEFSMLPGTQGPGHGVTVGGAGRALRIVRDAHHNGDDRGVFSTFEGEFGLL